MLPARASKRSLTTLSPSLPRLGSRSLARSATLTATVARGAGTAPWTLIATFSLNHRARLGRGLAFALFPAMYADAGQRPQTLVSLSAEHTVARRPAIWPEIVRLLKADWPLLLAVVLSTVAGALASLALPRVMGQLVTVISKALLPSATAAAGPVSLWVALQPLNAPARRLLALFAVKGLLTFAHISLVSQLGENLAHRLRRELFASLINQEMGFFDASQSSELVARLATDVQEFKHTFKQCVTQGVRATTEVTGSVLHLLHLSPLLTGTLAATMPVLYLVGTLYGAFLRRVSRRAKEIEAQSLGGAGEALSNVRTVKAYAAEDREIAKLDAATARSARHNQALGMHIGAFQAITSTSIGSMILLVLYVGGAQVATGAMEPGDLMTYLMATQAAQRSLASLGVLVGQFIKAQSAAQRVFEFIHRTPRIPSHVPGARTLPDLQGEIEFRNVRFAYPTRPDQYVLDGFSLTIPAGQITAIIGLSGSGKSSCVKLVERFYDPKRGSVTVDGVDLRDLDPRWWREHVGYLAQMPTLFSASIRDNIRYGKPDATDAEVEAAARLANAHDFIAGFKDGYDTLVGQSGRSVSGGEAQRIALAAAILKNPRLLIIDEGTSALDHNSERLVQEALDKLMKGRTVIVIAHRLSTIQNADMIVVMGKPHGRILEKGTHTELMARRGVYYRLHNAGGEELLG
ncbi:hypothetical protein H9P43_004776 [Blastocladiella emersonii ATCC 22665]|nr:hypothetical protein H9P43_004776 [Blastocladiella emersonii ATCC 22665]